jgi:hypothetical protein
MSSVNYFKIRFDHKDMEFGIDSAELHLWSANVQEEKIGLYINVQAKRKSFVTEQQGETYERYVKPRIYTEWLDIPMDAIKNKDYRTLEAVKVNFTDSGEMTAIERMVWTEAPGALYVDNHGVFKSVTIDFKYLGKGIFNVTLKGSARYDTPFEVSADVPLQVKLQAYDKRATKEELLSYFDRIVDPSDFEGEWKYRDEDLFFTASVKV